MFPLALLVFFLVIFVALAVEVVPTPMSELKHKEIILKENNNKIIIMFKLKI